MVQELDPSVAWRVWRLQTLVCWVFVFHSLREMARSNSLPWVLAGWWLESNEISFPKKRSRDAILKEMAPKGEGLSEKHPKTPSFVSVWPNNFELLSMVNKVSKRKHILEFPLFKKKQKTKKWKSKKNEVWTRKTLDESKSYTTQTHTLKHIHTHNTMHTWTHTSKNVYLYDRFLEIDILSKYGWQINCNLFSFNTVSS